MNRIRLTLACLVALALAACAGQPRTVTKVVKEPYEVRVPVVLKPPARLYEPVPGPSPRGQLFIAPCNPKLEADCRASSALTPEGEDELRYWIDSLYLRIEAWEAYGKGGSP